MESVNVERFLENLDAFADLIASRHEPMRVVRQDGADFIVMSHEEWESEQETIYVLQDPYLIKQIRDSRKAHDKEQGYIPTQEAMDKILSDEEE